ncbi:AEC family transporter [Thalassovita sp.]|jgi:predicted permease|uniref:AEC family transporter n=1 Tax=Thalassovita sp. TaxID=1979401 RepID=UPI003B59952F
MHELLNVVLPVFLVIGFGYAAVWRRLITQDQIDGLMIFAQNFAIPCLLFLAISRLDLGQSFDLRLLASFYSGAAICFVLAMCGARFLFGRPWEDSVAIGFVGLFSNSLLLGLPITERAYGPEGLGGNYAIIAVHAPFCYMLGITVMELVRARSRSPLRLVRQVARAMFRNALVLGLVLGFAVNLTETALPAPLTAALELMGRAALPTALFGLGGVLFRYRPEGDLKVIAFVLTIGLVVHPLLVLGMAKGLALPIASERSAVLTAAMAPGVNTYLFANMYGVGKRVAASSILLGTILCIFTAWVWLQILP